MASGNQESEPMVPQEGSPHNSKDLERVKEHLKQVVKKNQDLKEMLLYTTQELEKEKENSKRIVETLTERLMESREMINKLEVENMRYKKDCMLAVELLQCNRSVDTGHVSTTMRKLSDYTDQGGRDENSEYGNPFALDKQAHTNIGKDDMKNLEPTRPRTFSKKKTKSESQSSHEDTTALLDKQDTKDRKGDLGSSSTGEDTTLRYNKDIVGQQKQSDNPQDFEKANLKRTTKNSNEEKECLTNICKQEGTAIVNKKQEIPDSNGDLNDVENEVPNGEDSFLNENEIKNENESTKKDKQKPLIANETEPLAKQNVSRPGSSENTRTGRAKAQAERQNSGSELHRNARQGLKLLSKATAKVEEDEVSPVMATEEDDADENEDEKLLSSGAKISEEKLENDVQCQLPTLTAASENEKHEVNGNSEPASDEVEVNAHVSDGEKSLVEDSTAPENDTNTPVVEAEDEALIAEEDTPLV